jgi:ketosteroid isomerase-like protein
MDTDAFFSLLADDVVWDLSRSPFPDAGIYHGIEGVRDWFRGLDDAFGPVRYEVERMFEVDERVAVLMHVRGQGPSSQIAVDYSFVPVMTFREGKIVRMDRYDDWSAATAALGRST